MPPEQISILFEDDDSPKRKRVSKKNIMQSEEDWTPQALPEEAKPAAETASGESVPAKARRATPRGRKPRAAKPKEDESHSAPAESASPAPSAEPPAERPQRPKRAARRPAEAPAESVAAEPTTKEERPGRSEDREQRPSRPDEREQRSDRSGDREQRHSRSDERDERPTDGGEAQAPRGNGGDRDRDEGRPTRGEDRPEGRGGEEGRNQEERRFREDRPREDRPREDRPREDRPREDRPREDRGGQENDGRPRGEFQHGGGRRDDRFQPRHGGGGGGGGGGGNPNNRRDDNFRNKKKKKKGRFERPGGGGGGGHPHYAPQGGGAPHHQPQHQQHHRPGDLPEPAKVQDLSELERIATEATGETLDLARLFEISLHELVESARAMEIVLDAAPNRRLLISRILEKAHEEKRPIIDRGILDIAPAGFGFVTRHANNYRVQAEDSFVAEGFIRRFGLKKGHMVEVQVRPPEQGERCPAVLKVNQVMGIEPEKVADIVPFEDLVPYYPLQRILLEIQRDEPIKDVSMRAIDLLTPIGFGQRGLIVAPPRTGKTVILQQIANSIATNNPQAHLIVLLIDERPEEVTDFRRHTKGEVVSSTFDEPADSHVEVAEAVIEKARRMVEAGRHVIILLDSITRLARAYNAMMPSSGKILSGGVEANALQKPKRFFGAARNIEGGGSLTILATALIDTGSRMDEVIFEEFKGTGNMEIHLDRALVDKRTFPAINIEKSGTRKEELLYHPDELNRIYSLRRAIQGVPVVEAMEMLVQRLRKTRSNAEFLLAMNR